MSDTPNTVLQFLISIVSLGFSAYAIKAAYELRRNQASAGNTLIFVCAILCVPIYLIDLAQGIAVYSLYQSPSLTSQCNYCHLITLELAYLNAFLLVLVQLRRVVIVNLITPSKWFNNVRIGATVGTVLTFAVTVLGYLALTIMSEQFNNKVSSGTNTGITTLFPVWLFISEIVISYKIVTALKLHRRNMDSFTTTKSEKSEYTQAAFNALYRSVYMFILSALIQEILIVYGISLTAKSPAAAHTLYRLSMLWQSFNVILEQMYMSGVKTLMASTRPGAKIHESTKKSTAIASTVQNQSQSTQVNSSISSHSEV